MVLQSVGVERQSKPPVLPRWDMERNRVPADVKAKSSSLPNYARSNYSVFQHLHKTGDTTTRSPMYDSAENIAARGAEKTKGKGGDTEKEEKKKKWSIGGWFRRRKKSGGDESSESSDEDGSKRGGFLMRRKSKREKQKPEIILVREPFPRPLELPENGQPTRTAYTNGYRSRLQVPPHYYGNYLESTRNDNSLDRLSRSSHDSNNSKDKRNLKTGSSSSIDSISRRFMREATKAKVEAIRENLRDSSSEEDKNDSLNRFHNQESMKSDGSANRKSKSARMERYLKRLSRDYEAKMQEQQKENHKFNIPKWAATIVYQESNGFETFKSRSASSSPTQSPHMRQRMKLQAEPEGDLPVYSARLATTRPPAKLPGHIFGYRQCSFDRLSEPGKRPTNSVINSRHRNVGHDRVSASCEELLKKQSYHYPEHNSRPNKGSIFELGIPYPRKREDGRPPTPPPRDPRNRYYRGSEGRPASMAFGMHDYINIDKQTFAMPERAASNGHIGQPYKPVPFPPRPLSSENSQRSYSTASSSSLTPANSLYLSSPSPCQQGIPPSSSAVYSYTDQPPALPPKQRRPLPLQLSQYECDNFQKVKCNYTDDMKRKQVENSRSGSLDTKTGSAPSVNGTPVSTKSKGYSNSWGSKVNGQGEKVLRKAGFPIKNLRDMFEAKSQELQQKNTKTTPVTKTAEPPKIFGQSEKKTPKSKFYTELTSEKTDSESDKQPEVRGIRPLSMVLEKSESTEKESSAGEQKGSPSDKSSPPPMPPSRKFTRRTSLEAAEENIEKIVTREKQRQNNANFEEAIIELEAIYQSLKLNDEDLLDRAERRDLPERYQINRTETNGPIDVKALESLLQWSSAGSHESVKSGSRPRTPSLRRAGIPDKIADDMAYRKTQEKKSPQITALEILANSGSYLEKSPALTPAVSIEHLNHRADSPNITYDDAAFRNIRDANLIKIIDPQPPFGIPLGPLTQSSENDYLHVQPEEKHRPTFIPSKNVDTVRDDFAYRNLRKDQKDDHKNAVNVEELDRILREEPDMPPPGKKKKRVVRSLSANIAGIVFRDEVVDHSRHPSGLCKSPSSSDIQEYDYFEDPSIIRVLTPRSVKHRDDTKKQNTFADAVKESHSDRESSVPYSPRNNPSWVERASLSDDKWKEVGTSSETLTDKSAIKKSDSERNDSASSDISDFQRRHRGSSSESQKESLFSHPNNYSSHDTSSPSKRLSSSSQDSFKMSGNFNCKPKPFYKYSQPSKDCEKKSSSSSAAKIENKDTVTIDESQLQEILRDIAKEAAQLSQINDDDEPVKKDRDRKTSVDNLFTKKKKASGSGRPATSSLDRTNRGVQVDESGSHQHRHYPESQQRELKAFESEPSQPSSKKTQTERHKNGSTQLPALHLPNEDLKWCDESEVSAEEPVASRTRVPVAATTDLSFVSNEVPEPELVWRHAPKWPAEGKDQHPGCAAAPADSAKEITTTKRNGNGTEEDAKADRPSSTDGSLKRTSRDEGSYSDESTSYGEEQNQASASNSSDRRHGKRLRNKRTTSSRSHKESKAKSVTPPASGSETSAKTKGGGSSNLTVPGGSSQLSSDSSSMWTGDVSEADANPRRRPHRQRDKSRKRKSNLNRSMGEESCNYQLSDDNSRRRRRLSLDSGPTEKSPRCPSPLGLTSPDLLKNAQVAKNEQQANCILLPAIVTETMDRENVDVSDDNLKKESHKFRKLPLKLSPLKKPEFPGVFKKSDCTSPGSSSSFPCSPVDSPGSYAAFLSSPLLDMKPPPAPDLQKGVSQRISSTPDSSPPVLQLWKKLGEEGVDQEKGKVDAESIRENPFGKLKDRLFLRQDSSPEKGVQGDAKGKREEKDRGAVTVNFVTKETSGLLETDSKVPVNRDKSESLVNFQRPQGETPLSPPRKRRFHKHFEAFKKEEAIERRDEGSKGKVHVSGRYSILPGNSPSHSEISRTKHIFEVKDHTKNLHSGKSDKVKSHFLTKYNLSENACSVDEWTEEDVPREVECDDSESSVMSGANVLESGCEALSSASRSSCEFVYISASKSKENPRPNKNSDKCASTETSEPKESQPSNEKETKKASYRIRRSKSLVGIECLVSGPPSRLDEMDSELAMVLKMRRSQEGNGGEDPREGRKENGGPRENPVKKDVTVAELVAKFVEEGKPEKPNREKRSRRRYQTQIVTMQELDDYKSCHDPVLERGALLSQKLLQDGSRGKIHRGHNDRQTDGRQTNRHSASASSSDSSSFVTAECCTPDSLKCPEDAQDGRKEEQQIESTAQGTENVAKTALQKVSPPKASNSEKHVPSKSVEDKQELPPGSSSAFAAEKSSPSSKSVISKKKVTVSCLGKKDTSESSGPETPIEPRKTEESPQKDQREKGDEEMKKESAEIDTPKSPPRMRRSKNATSPQETTGSSTSEGISSHQTSSRLNAIKSVLLKKELTDAIKQNEKEKKNKEAEKKEDRKSQGFLGSFMGATSIKDRMANFRHPKTTQKSAPTKITGSKTKRTEQHATETGSKQEDKTEGSDTKRKSVKVEIPATDQGLQEFFNQEKGEPASPAEISDQHLKDLATRDHTQKLSTKKSIKLFGRSQSSGNPVKKLAKRTDLQQSYLELQKN